MALKLTYEKYSRDFEHAYWRVMGMKGNKMGMAVEVWIFADPYEAEQWANEVAKQPRILHSKYVLDTKLYQFNMTEADIIVPASSTVLNFTYLLLKTLPEFSNAIDV